MWRVKAKSKQAAIPAKDKGNSHQGDGNGKKQLIPEDILKLGLTKLADGLIGYGVGQKERSQGGLPSLWGEHLEVWSRH